MRYNSLLSTITVVAVFAHSLIYPCFAQITGRLSPRNTVPVPQDPIDRPTDHPAPPTTTAAGQNRTETSTTSVNLGNIHLKTPILFIAGTGLLSLL
ncbi:Ethanolamine-phosphate cytidylyltransferase, putative [Candida maltosa Xu316]|uniref:Ethanolamine-phosphate cytidylyltransferase, putative n=1 Tax=Candida maltosa (strain Xu316) TaxID=1245528 RepID=M3J863_CANMX|nr:Ethanolamine-phosphate cytidylyltransferase, putative [Candida maltosa Xu316]